MSLAQLWNEEANWNAAVLTVLAAGNTGVPTANIQIAQSITSSRSPRIEIEVEGVGRASEHMGFANSAWYYDHRFADVRVDLVTARTAATAQDHGSMRGRIRYLFTREAQKFVSPALTWYAVNDVQEQGSNVYARDPEGDREDVTSFRYRFDYAIPPSVVPTV